MERRERRAVADRHDGRFRQALLEQPVERRLRRLVERGGGLVEEQEIGRLQEGARDAEALLLAERQHAVPVRLLVEPLRQGGQADGADRLREPLAVVACRAPPDRSPPRPACPTGKYGRCGSIISCASFGTTTRPEPNGQMPAIARNSVDLPEPDGPVTSTGSPRGILTLSDATSGVPVGRFTATSSSSTARAVSAGLDLDHRRRVRRSLRRHHRQAKPIQPLDDRRAIPPASDTR